MLIKNKYGNKSVTLSILWYGFITCTIKLLLSGIKITNDIQFSNFTGVDYAAALSAIGTIYQASKVIYNKYDNNIGNIDEFKK